MTSSSWKPPQGAIDVAQVRYFVQTREGVRRLCMLTWSRRDASIFVFPTPLGHGYLYGRSTRPAVRRRSYDIDMKGQRSSQHLPKVSLHQSGRVHIRAPDGLRSRILHLPLLAAYRGEHVLTVTPDSIAALPLFHGTLRHEGPKFDSIAFPPNSSDTVSLLVYLNGREPNFETDHEPQSITQLTRPGLEDPLYVGVLLISSVPLAGAERPGVTTLVAREQTPHTLFLRCL